MKLKVVLEDQEILPPRVWDQLKRGIHELGQCYGMHIEFPGDSETRSALEDRWLQEVERYQKLG